MTAIPFLCKFGLHKYSVWGEKFSIPNAKYAFEFQQRVCLKCGHVNERTVR